MNRLARSLILLLLPLSSAAGARDTSAQDPSAVPQEPTTPVDAELELSNLQNRLTVPVAVGAKGPYDFVIDTGAERTVVSRELAGSLNLSPGKSIRLTTMTGSSEADTVIVPGLAIESIGERHTIVAPALAARNLGAAGLLGIDTLQNHRVTIDFETGLMTVRKSEKRRRLLSHGPDEVVVTAKSLFGQLIVTDAYYGDTRVQVVLDTGSQVTMGNSALRRRVGNKLGEVHPVQLTSVTGETTMVDYAMVPRMKVGDVQFNWIPVAFADVLPFERFGLMDRPAVLLGMDALRYFRRVDIDFPNRQVRFLLPRGTGGGTRSIFSSHSGMMVH